LISPSTEDDICVYDSYNFMSELASQELGLHRLKTFRNPADQATWRSNLSEIAQAVPSELHIILGNEAVETYVWMVFPCAPQQRCRAR
jgi:hypothetical protein